MSEQSIINDIKKHDWKESWLDFSVFLYERGRLVIVGSDDLSYYHNLEITIETPSYINGVMDWSCDLDEGFMKISIQDNGSQKLSTLEFYSDDELKFKVVGESISVNFDTVFFYKRDNLSTGERLAYWVK
ncbi:hypothetical protein [Yersinia sp. IP36721]|uniref:hypothetical protein n=1 Tax=Yersinia sp. IP36721 TaxID=2161716 RepID=UPI000EB1FC99|nr:hypothetical protein [Yersinia sp. IP36721]